MQKTSIMMRPYATQMPSSHRDEVRFSMATSGGRHGKGGASRDLALSPPDRYEPNPGAKLRPMAASAVRRERSGRDASVLITLIELGVTNEESEAQQKEERAAVCRETMPRAEGPISRADRSSRTGGRAPRP